jgi:hypothetical protein
MIGVLEKLRNMTAFMYIGAVVAANLLVAYFGPVAVLPVAFWACWVYNGE